MQLPYWNVYCKNTTGMNALAFDLGEVTVFFSYKTPVAFRHIPKGKGTETLYETVVRENDWGPTTGRHLNAIDDGDKKSRIPGALFETLLRKALDN